jgi:asparagine synthase (glutamine-hydrolysing)
MCGFAAVMRSDGEPVDPDVLRRMTDVIFHRGPDDEGHHVEGPVGFGFRRLAILDLSAAAHQPMFSEDGNLVLVFNGEIFNYVELRRTLESLGHRFRSSGDTEVLLRAYQEWGRECLPKLNGMWAFLIYDRRERTVFGSRDRFGIKPLYRYSSGEAVLLGSEIKCILASGLHDGEPNWSLISRYLTGGSLDQLDRGVDTFYRGIQEVPPGSGFDIDASGRWREWRYWNLEELPELSVPDAVATFGELLRDAVRLRMRSDVPVGVSLSGGLDSTAIISLMAELRQAAGADAAPLEAFSFVTPEFDESAFIAATIRATGASFNPVEISPISLWEKLDRVLWYHDEPVHSLNALISYEIYGMAARRGVKVMLSGSGADETIGGYPSYFRDYWYTLLRRGNVVGAWRQMSERIAVDGGGGPARPFMRLLRHAAQTEARRSAAYRSVAQRRREGELKSHPWFDPALLDHVPTRDEPFRDLTLDAQLRAATEIAPLPFYLRLEDRNSMAHSVEARVPFLDYRLVQLLFQLPAEWKLRGKWNKYVLRESMRGIMPEVVRARVDKMGFPIPAAEWFRRELYEPMQDLLGSEAARSRGIYQIEAIRRDLETHRRGAVDAAIPLFNVAQLELWFSLPHAKNALIPAVA